MTLDRIVKDVGQGSCLYAFLHGFRCLFSFAVIQWGKISKGECESMKYLAIFFISMIPLIELRGAIPMASVWGLNMVAAYILCVLANMLPVPIIYFFARKVLEWGKDKRFIGKFFTWCIEKGERGGQKLVKTAGIPLPGTGAWTGTLAASFLNMGIKSTALAVSLGVIIAGIIMAVVSALGLHIFGL